MQALYAKLCKCSEEAEVKKTLIDGMKTYSYDLVDHYTKVIVPLT